MSRFRNLTISLVSIVFFAIGFLSLGYMVMTTTSAQTAPYLNMEVSGATLVSSGVYTTSASHVDIYWMIFGIASCSLTNQSSGVPIGSYTHIPAQYGGGIPAEIISVSKPTFSGSFQTVVYSLSCVSTSGTTLTDTATVKYTQGLTIASNGNTTQVQSGQISSGTLNTNLQNSGSTAGPALVNQTQVVSNTNTSQIAAQQATATQMQTQQIFSGFDLKVNGLLAGSGGSVVIPYAPSVTLSWSTSKTSGCTIGSATPSSATQILTHKLYNPTNTTNTGSLSVLVPVGMTADFTRTYSMDCVNASGAPVGSDTVQVTFSVPTNPSGGNSTNNNGTASSCAINIDNFDLDQDDVYGDDSDDDVSLAWNSSSASACTHACSLTYEGNTYTVTNNDNDYDVYNIDSDHTFVLECYQNNNPSNSVTSTEHLDYHTSGSSSSTDTPDIATLPAAQQVGSATARIRGTFDDGDCSGLETGFLLGKGTNAMSLISNYQERNGAGTVALEIQGLTPGTVYFYQHVARGCSGISQGSVESFTTTGSSIPYTTPTNIPSTSASSISNTTNTSSGSQQIRVQEIAEDGTVGEAQFNTLDIGVGYVPDAQKRRASGLPLWLLIGGGVLLLLVALKFIHEAFTHSDDHHRTRY